MWNFSVNWLPIIIIVNGLLAYNTDSTCNAMSIKNDIEYKQFVQ